MNRAEGNCWDNDKCSSLSSNFVADTDHDGDGTAAAGYIYDINSTASISQTLLKNNHANESALFYVRHFGNLFLEGNVITDNGPNGQPFASDLITLYAVTNAANLDFFYNTIAGNTVDNHFKLFTNLGMSKIGRYFLLNSHQLIQPPMFDFFRNIIRIILSRLGTFLF